jgi:DNA-binding response OmpR family regulator
VVLSEKEYALLRILANEPGRTFTKRELLRDIWGEHTEGRTRTLDACAALLRRKLAANADTNYIINVWGVGYRLTEKWMP